MIPLVSYHFENQLYELYTKTYFHINSLHVMAALNLPIYKTEQLHLIPAYVVTVSDSTYNN